MQEKHHQALRGVQGAEEKSRDSHH